MNSPTRPLLLIIVTHPIQYQAPLFRAICASGAIDLVVGFLDFPDSRQQGAGFGVDFQWDIPLTEGYRWVHLNGTVLGGVRASSFMGRLWRHPIRDLRVLGPCAVMVMGWNQVGLLQGWLAAKFLQVPLIVRGESNAKRPRALWKRCLHKILLGMPDRFIAIGKSNRDFYLRSSVHEMSIGIGPYFVDNDFFASRASAVDRAAERTSWGITHDDVCLLFVGKFESKKRPFDLLAAVDMLPLSVRCRVVVLMVGAGLLEASLRTQAKAAGIRVAWAGFLNQSEIPAAYAAADVIVLPSDHGETWGLVVNEAMACGVPAIVSDQVGCANDLVRSRETGEVFPVGDIVELANAIEELVTNPERRRAMGQAARTIVVREYTIERSVEAIEGAVSELVGRPLDQSDKGASLG